MNIVLIYLYFFLDEQLQNDQLMKYRVKKVRKLNLIIVDEFVF